MRTKDTGDFQKTIRRLSIQIDDERMKTVTPALELSIEAIKPLMKIDIPKEIEPTSFFRNLSLESNKT